MNRADELTDPITQIQVDAQRLSFDVPVNIRPPDYEVRRLAAIEDAMMEANRRQGGIVLQFESERIIVIPGDSMLDVEIRAQVTP